MTELEHHVVRCVHDIVDRRLPQRFETLPHPVGRGSNFHAAQHARRIAAAQFRRLNLNMRCRRGIFRNFARVSFHRLERLAIQRGSLARDAVVAQAIGAVRGQLGVKQRACRGLLQRLHRCAGKRKPRAQILRRRLHVDELFNPVVKNFHRYCFAPRYPTACVRARDCLWVTASAVT